MNLDPTRLSPAFLRRLPTRRLLTLTALTLAALLLVPATADSAGKKKKGDKKTAQTADVDEVFEGRTDVIEVQIPVNVHLRSGEPVRGLTAEDFKIYEDGELQKITDFEVVDLDLVLPGANRTEVDTAISAAARRHVLLLFDLSFSKPSSILKAREAARDFVLNDLHPTDLAAVATHSVESGARIVVTFTPDRAQLARGIDTLGAPGLTGLTRRDPLRFMIEEPSNMATESSRDALMNDTSTVQGMLNVDVLAHMRIIAREMMKAERSFSRGRIASWSRSMGTLGRLMDSVQGRKHLIYFSEGFDEELLLGRSPNIEDQESEENLANIRSGNYAFVDTDDLYGNTGLQASLGVMLQEFRRADVAIQAVDISGLEATATAADRIGSNGEHALFYLANETGGELFEDANDFGKQLKKVMHRSSVTYLLTVRPSNLVPDGTYHRIKVKTELPRGTKLSAREGYYAPRPYGELHPIEKNLLASDAIAAGAPQDDLELNVLAAPFRASQGRWYVPIIVEIAGAPLLVNHAASKLPVELYAYVTDEHGEMKDFFTQLVTLDLDKRKDSFVKTGLKYYGHLDLPPGEHLVRVLVRNAETGRSGVQTTRVEVPTESTADPFLLPPFFLEKGGNWFLVREKEETLAGRSVVYPFTVNGEPYIPSARPLLETESDVEVCLVAYNLGAGQLSVNTTIVAADGRIMDGGRLSLVERTITGIEGLDKVLARFRPSGLVAGNYTLQVALTDGQSGLTEMNSIPFTLRN